MRVKLALGILGLPLESPETKCHLDVGPVTSHRVYYKGKVVTSPSLGRGESCKSEFVRGSSYHQKCLNYALTNLLFGLCRSV